MGKPTKAIAILFSTEKDKTIFALSATDDIPVHLGKLVSLIVKNLGGKGGGSAQRCEGFVPTDKIDHFIDFLQEGLFFLLEDYSPKLPS